MEPHNVHIGEIKGFIRNCVHNCDYIVHTSCMEKWVAKEHRCLFCHQKMSYSKPNCARLIYTICKYSICTCAIFGTVIVMVYLFVCFASFVIYWLQSKNTVWVSKNFFRKWTFINVQKSNRESWIQTPFSRNRVCEHNALNSIL